MEKNNNLQRLSVTRASQKRTGILCDNEILTLEFFVDDLGLNIAEELEEIRQGKKKREETNIDLDVKVLNSLSNAVNALANYRKSEC